MSGHIKPQTGITIIVVCFVLTGLRIGTLESGFDTSYELDTTNPFIMSDHCRGLLDYHVNEERRIEKKDVKFACPSPFEISESSQASTVYSPDAELYGFREIHVDFQTPSLRVITK